MLSIWPVSESGTSGRRSFRNSSSVRCPFVNSAMRSSILPAIRRTGESGSAARYSEEPPQKGSGEPPGTLSQIVAYLDSKGRQVAVVHQYLKRDGSIGGSGRPDPKKVFYKGQSTHCVSQRSPQGDYWSLRAVMVICTTSLVTLAGYAPALISVPPPLKAFSFQLFRAEPATGT